MQSLPAPADGCSAEGRATVLPQDAPAKGKPDCHSATALQEFTTQLLVQLSDAFKVLSK